MLDVGAALIQAAERSPERLAVVAGRERLDYGAWAERALRLAGALEGRRVATLLQNTLEAATLHWACQLSGRLIVPLNWRLKGEEIDYCLRDSEADLLVFGPEAAEAVAAAPAAQAIRRIETGPAFDALLEGPPAAPVASAEDWSVMLYTSGTTGRPKGVPRRHRAERAAAIAHVAQNLYAPGEVALGVMPLYHTMGVRSLLASALVDGAFVCQPRFDAGRALELIEREGVTALYLAPTLYHDLLAHPGFAPERVRRVRKLGFAGASMTDGLLRRLDEAFRPELFVNHYGSSEIYTFTVCPDAPAKPGSAGRAGLNQRIRVESLDGARDAAPGEEGEILALMAGDEAFEGYWRRPDADARALRDGWYRTGDTGRFDADGDLFVTGRVDDMIVTGGENVSPVEVESALSLHPAVAEVAVAGLADERWGQIVAAFVVAREPVTAEALDAHCRAGPLADFKRPRRYVFVEEIPKSPVGKILRRLLTAPPLPTPGPSATPQRQRGGTA